ncbi:MAG: ornithine cyclodeaminase [Aeromicrobium sp.]
MSSVPFVDVANMARWMADRGVEPLLVRLTDALEADFRRWESFELVPRVATHSVDGVIELMPTSDGETFGFKYVNGHPINPSRGLQTVTAFGVLADVRTGYPTFLAEMTLLTALRTGATSALAARWLARPDSRVMALIGTGSQAEFQALAFRAVCGIDQIRAYDVDPGAVAKFVRNAERCGLDVYVARDVADAVEGADIITTCTADKRSATVLADDRVCPGVHINAIGGDCPGKTELDAAVLQRARVVVEYEPQTRIEGEIQQMHPTFAVTELHEVIVGGQRRQSAEEITVFDSVGFAVEDVCALRFLRADVLGTDFVDELDLVASPADPRDLYGLVDAVRPVAAQRSLRAL